MLSIYTKEKDLNLGVKLYEDDKNYRLDIIVDGCVGYSWSKDHTDVDSSSLEEKDIKIIIDLTKKGVQKQIKKLYEKKADIKARILTDVQDYEFDSELLNSWGAELGRVERLIAGQKKGLAELGKVEKMDIKNWKIGG